MKQKKGLKKVVRGLPKNLQHINVHAAGIDIGSRSHFVAVPEGIDEMPVREFSSFTGDLEKMAAWLISCGVTTVAWSLLVFTGYRHLRFLKSTALRSSWLMLVTSRMFPVEKVMSWIVSGCSSCILTDCFVALFGRMRRSVRFALMFARGL